MESPANGSGRRMGHITDARRGGPKPGRQVVASTLEVTDVVRRGMGRGSRIDLTILSAGQRVRLTGLPGKHVLSYSRIEKAAVEEGVVLPWLRLANRAWRKVIAPAMERARTEPWLEGEEIADAIAAEIREWLGGAPRGERAADLIAGKVVRKGHRLLVNARTLAGAVRRRLVDDVLPQATIAEAARAHLGMRESRPRFAGVRPCAWAFPLPLAKATQYRELHDGASTEPVEERETRSWIVDPIHGCQTLGDISHTENEVRSGSDGPSKNAFSRGTTGQERNDADDSSDEARQRDAGAGSGIVDPIHGPQVLSDISHKENGMRSGSNGREKNAFSLRDDRREET